MALDDFNSMFSNINLSIKRFMFGNKAQLAFLEDFYTLINDGLPANRAIDMMAQATTGLTHDVAVAIGQKVAEGQALAEGMRGWFSPNTVEIIRVGEEGGALAETVKSAMNALAQRSGAIGAFVAAVTYPTLVLIVASILIVFLNLKVLPEFRDIKPESQWPDAGRTLVSMANFIESWWWLVILLIIAVVLIVKRILTHYTGELRPTLDKIPPFSLYRKLASARVMETMGLLVANGIVFKQAIKVMQQQAGPYVASHLIMMEHLMSMGKGNIADMLSTGLIEEKDILRLRVMAEVKGFEHGLVRMGLRGAEETQRTIKFISKIIGAIMLICGGALIMMIVNGIYTTGMSLGQA